MNRVRVILGMIILTVITMPITEARGQGDYLSEAEIFAKIDAGYAAAIAGVTEGIIDDAIMKKIGGQTPVPRGVECFRQMKSLISQEMQKGQFPLVASKSRTSEYIPEICKDVFSMSGFNPKIPISCGFNPELSADAPKLAEYLMLKLVGFLERAKSLETILPSSKETETILKQVKELKAAMKEILKNRFPDISEECIDKSLYKYFSSFEKGPTGVITSAAKRCLTEEQMEKIKSQWENFSLEKNDSISLHKDKLEKYKNFGDNGKIYSIFIERLLDDYTLPFVRMIREEFYANLPAGFVLPERSERLKAFDKEASIRINKKNE
ncbi:MAG: hypothetical protein AB1656_00600 [Candidatus Omnitrophota bacterium]